MKKRTMKEILKDVLENLEDWETDLENVGKEYFEYESEVDSYDKFKPMLAHDYTKRPQESGFSQPKLDGIRCIATKKGLFTRAGKAINTCGHIEHDLIEFFKEAQVDGREDWVLNSLNTGQVLSIPLILVGLWLVFRNNN